MDAVICTAENRPVLAPLRGWRAVVGRVGSMDDSKVAKIRCHHDRHDRRRRGIDLQRQVLRDTPGQGIASIISDRRSVGQTEPAHFSDEIT